jgi:hypothetical protein
MSTKQKQVVVLACLLAVSATNVMAQGGQTAIEAATTELGGYVDVIANALMVIGAIVGLVGGIRVFQKWNGGDKDINKDILAWGGSCVFLLVVPIFVKAFFIG